jgi:hypothetical protein
MSISDEDCLNSILTASKPVILINGFEKSEWYRKPKGSKKGLWLKGGVEV